MPKWSVWCLTIIQLSEDKNEVKQIQALKMILLPHTKVLIYCYCKMSTVKTTKKNKNMPINIAWWKMWHPISSLRLLNHFYTSNGDWQIHPILFVFYNKHHINAEAMLSFIKCQKTKTKLKLHVQQYVEWQHSIWQTKQSHHSE